MTRKRRRQSLVDVLARLALGVIVMLGLTAVLVRSLWTESWTSTPTA